MMNTKQLTSLHNVIEYLIEDESEDYWGYQRTQEVLGPLDHIYHDLVTLQEYLDDRTKEESKEEQRPDWHSQGDGEYFDPIKDWLD